MVAAGMEFVSTLTVTEAHTAEVLGSGDMRVFATPAMVALMENAAMRCVAAVLDDGLSTVGGEICVTHLKPTAVGSVVSARAVVTAVEGRKLVFEVEAFDSEGVIGRGSHVRFVVDRAKFMSKVELK